MARARKVAMCRFPPQKSTEVIFIMLLLISEIFMNAVRKGRGHKDNGGRTGNGREEMKRDI